MSSHTAQTELKLIGKLIVEGDIVCQTGLHIGAGKGSLEIGGADNPVVKDAFGLPYIPGQFAPRQAALAPGTILRLGCAIRAGLCFQAQGPGSANSSE
jgi:hypothetical protein